MTDNEIIRLYFARNENAIKETKNSYGEFCRRVIFGIIRCNEDVDECENDTYLKMWNKIPPSEPISVKAFLARIARNTALDRYRRYNAKMRNINSQLSFDELDECISDNSETNLAQLGSAIDRFLRQLDIEKRVVFVRKYWFLDTISEISVRCDMSESKIKSMLMRTRKELLIFLEKEGFEL